MQTTETSVELSLEAGVATLTLNRPQRLNSFNPAMHQALAAALDRLRDDVEVRVLVLTGAGRAFCAGQDLSDRAVLPGQQAVDLGQSIEDYYAPLVRRLRDMPKPVIAAVNGVAAGAGANIALACDLVIAARSARFTQAFSKVGLMPDSGGSYWLPRLLGQARAMGLALLAEPLPAEQAEEWGLIWRCVDDEDFPAAVRQLAEQLAGGPTLAYARIKRALQASEGNSLEQQLQLERDTQRELGFSADYREGVAAFLAKRPPRFGGQ
ncbi:MULTISPECIES: 2-(1,2-epoxy-1,2-dihydrophenyl)acetyl-CoA isomerase PaaG [Chromobacterium]|uniref:2-(1,2-epoxy-1,2-dihydrophenyl)acetyl-CoA isomerase n=2 Tax=Chromobacterium TaxID=535 RepID=A0ABS3GK75_9NEIS|nr:MULTISPECIES: 2-(1,2-epoxy-1,2-dihydrophenyl)acetyl-CoA isomerase PaaG [Chromobacterium]AXT48332.1 2-(1,2-epoxy-1,2-dihydrophenyl)acetyl-CoA isomerase [Chromobacterium rhizoryzae]MBK0415555.1 2-(1,2-epoxy-1,2-dihydrophenyl)acetyl-CoA isomerase [Chromobacterium haemolyticum]MBO0415025.1 2-(1,2-epoxy-1,2-dihydrophenyl)acetyl-CoA isomerase [Chromobacterium haemolyticum]MBO0498286.1 2-(1,2-epoxy-1,2-dihydrophenyl)acetyl-CoA isomerase [Chromobacterium haemolyticum]OQS35815.1 2-(1,2-epoxy-1,2-dih